MTFQAYPKWLPAKDGIGTPLNPGFVLVENEDQERDVAAGKEAPRHLNPMAEADKPLDDMSHDELIASLDVAKASAPDDRLRKAVKALRGKVNDAAGDEVAPDPAAEANKGAKPKPANAPKAKPLQATNTIPGHPKPEAHPAGNIATEAAKPKADEKDDDI